MNRAFCAARLPPAACGLWQGGAVGGLGEEAQCLLTLPPPPTTPELLQPSCAGGPGVLSEQQVLGGLSWQEVRARPEGWRATSGMVLPVAEPSCTLSVFMEQWPSQSFAASRVLSLCPYVTFSVADIMGEQRWWMKLSYCASVGPWKPLIWILPSGELMSSPTPGPQPIWLPTQPFCSLMTESWGWTCLMGASEYGWDGQQVGG